MTNSVKRSLIVGTLLSTMGLMGCVSQGTYDTLQTQYQQSQQQNQQLQQQNSTMSVQLVADKAQIGRLQGAIKYTVNSDLLFASGGWEMRPQGKVIIARMAAKLAPTQQNKIMVNGYTDNAPIGPELQAQGVTSNQMLSQRRADTVMAYLIAQGLKPDLVEAHGFGDTHPVASNNTAKGRAANRRVELTLGGG